jgi:hypothetical protein
VIVDAQGKVVKDFEIEHSALGWKKFHRGRPPGFSSGIIESTNVQAPPSNPLRVSSFLSPKLGAQPTHSAGKRPGLFKQPLRIDHECLTVVLVWFVSQQRATGCNRSNRSSYFRFYFEMLT